MLRHGRPSAPIATVHPHTCIHAKWTTIFHVIDCTQAHAQHNIHTLHQAWQILQADGAHDKHSENKLAEEKKKRRVCVSICLNCTHMCGVADVRAVARLSDVNPGLFSFECVNFNLPVIRTVRQPALSSTLTAFPSVNWPSSTLTLATQSASHTFNESVCQATLLLHSQPACFPLVSSDRGEQGWTRTP